MKHLTGAFLLLAVMTISLGCTENDGDIGQLFGTWQVVSYTNAVTGETVAGDGLSVSFQSNIINIRHTDVEAVTYRDLAWGNYVHDGNQIVANFPDNWFDDIRFLTGDDSDSDDRVLTFTVERLTSSWLEVTYKVSRPRTGGSPELATGAMTLKKVK